MQNILILLFSFLLVPDLAFGEVALDEWDARLYVGPAFRYLDKDCGQVMIRPISRGEQVNGWIPYESESGYGGKNPSHSGYCKVTRDNHLIVMFECRKDGESDLPLAGAKYERIIDKGDIPSFKCTNGCTSDVPTMIHDAGNAEAGDDPTNIEYDKKLRACGFK